MDQFFLRVFENPVLYIGYVLAIVGAIGVLLFIAGFSGGIKHLFTYSESASHMEHARTRALWGVYLCMVTLGIWETIRVLLGEASQATLILVIILLSPAWIPWLRTLFTGTSGGGH